jgi:hypothetical protein
MQGWISNNINETWQKEKKNVINNHILTNIGRKETKKNEKNKEREKWRRKQMSVVSNWTHDSLATKFPIYRLHYLRQA